MDKSQNVSICKFSFVSVLLLLAAICIPLIFFPELTERFLSDLYTRLIVNLGWVYIVVTIAAFVFLLILAFSRFGKMKLGGIEDNVEYSDLSWAGMLFCAGVGAGLLFWAVIEWGYYYEAPPHNVESRSVAAIDWATSMGLFHWGIVAWAIYCLPTVAIAYPFYVKKVPYLRLSTALYGLVGDKPIAKPIAAIVDIIFIISLLGGAGYSLGISTPMISASVGYLSDLNDNFTLKLMTALVCSALFSMSAYFGLNKGIKRLSDANILLAFLLLAFVLFVGPTVFIIKVAINSLGFLASEFVTMMTWTDPYTDSGFVEKWTIFYWTWWIAYAPFVGLFVTRISRGRTIRQLIAGMLIYGTLGGYLFFMILGNYSLSLTLEGVVNTAEILKNEGGVAAIIATFTALPFPKLVLGIFCIVSVLFSATTYDSASYIIASTATKNLTVGQDPGKWHRLFWAFALAALPISLMYMEALEIMVSIMLLTSIPILLIGFFSAIALVKTLKRDFPFKPVVIKNTKVITNSHN
ncbi:BCCT family transporter [uncultured Shewanella sp.]|uniref:BCCT family transporter n=1 Tax=uncultured Shewanella sp. TaxID=173975 RepID=UPI0026140C3D|nr:BCCT family transporter [uncultured Shewanella sp.]